jgi:hypothetical protein
MYQVSLGRTDPRRGRPDLRSVARQREACGWDGVERDRRPVHPSYQPCASMDAPRWRLACFPTQRVLVIAVPEGRRGALVSLRKIHAAEPGRSITTVSSCWSKQQPSDDEEPTDATIMNEQAEVVERTPTPNPHPNPSSRRRKRRRHVIHLRALAGGSGQGLEREVAVDVPRFTHRRHESRPPQNWALPGFRIGAAAWGRAIAPLRTTSR